MELGEGQELGDRSVRGPEPHHYLKEPPRVTTFGSQTSPLQSVRPSLKTGHCQGSWVTRHKEPWGFHFPSRPEERFLSFLGASVSLRITQKLSARLPRVPSLEFLS